MRADALSILEAGLCAVEARAAIFRSVKARGANGYFKNKKISLKQFDHIYVVAIGKAAGAASAALEEIFGARISGGVALDVKKTKLKRIKSIAGTHPFPSLVNMRATGEIMALLKNLDSRDLLIAVVSGGGSALLCWPYQLKCDEVTAINRVLMKKGAGIHEMNTVRKHLSEIQGGQLARLAYPATVVGLIISDVPGDNLDLVASGPTVRDSSTVADAAAILQKYEVLKSCAIPGCDLRETPKDPVFFKKVTNVLIASGSDAALAMAGEARRRGWRPRIVSTHLEGEAREIGRLLAKEARVGEALIAAGETTVTIRGKGAGGRNQELALSALLNIKDNSLVASCASDGVDNSPAAGAIADGLIKKKARRLGLLPKKFLDNNDSYNFFRAAGGQIKTGITGTNVSDLMLVLRERE